MFFILFDNGDLVVSIIQMYVLLVCWDHNNVPRWHWHGHRFRAGKVYYIIMAMSCNTKP